ncbi:glycosyltransferase [Metallosphaera yellowstonensis]|uniref:glycosyltransferase n=1 Tax=Metallosphaera yellowstonensis TaxID=1111107 RepID=UPI00315DA3A4
MDDEKLSRLYSSADAFIFTSYAESFGLPPLEAMACGTPVVMSDNKGSRDYAVNGYNALVSQPGDVKSLSDNLIKVLQDDKLRQQLWES